MHKLYFAQAVDLLSPAEVKSKTEYVTELFISIGYVVCNTFEPFEDTDSAESVKNLVSSQIEKIKQCDLLVADFSQRDYPYIGCVGEVIYAYINKKKIYVITGESEVERRVWLKYHVDKFFRSVEELIDYLRA